MRKEMAPIFIKDKHLILFSFLVIAEAVERLLLARFLGETKPVVPELLFHLSTDSFTEESVAHLEDFGRAFESFKDDIRRGKLGKTAKFWMIYLDLMRIQHLIHTAIQENDFDLRLYCWRFYIPFYFAMDKQNYARYGSFYVETMININRIYPGLKPLLEKKGNICTWTKQPQRTHGN